MIPSTEMMVPIISMEAQVMITLMLEMELLANGTGCMAMAVTTHC